MRRMAEAVRSDVEQKHEGPVGDAWMLLMWARNDIRKALSVLKGVRRQLVAADPHLWDTVGWIIKKIEVAEGVIDGPVIGGDSGTLSELDTLALDMKESAE